MGNPIRVIGAALVPEEQVLPNNNAVWSIRAAQEVVIFADQLCIFIFDLRHARLHTVWDETGNYVCYRLINIRRNPERPLYTLAEVEIPEDPTEWLGKMLPYPPKEGWRDMRRLVQFHGRRAGDIRHRIEELHKRFAT